MTNLSPEGGEGAGGGAGGGGGGGGRLDPYSENE